MQAAYITGALRRLEESRRRGRPGGSPRRARRPPPSTPEGLDLPAFRRERVALIEGALRAALRGAFPETLRRAVSYAALSPGKRIRPLLVLAACEAAGGDPRAALPGAVAVELVHAMSLVHDDLPSMDDDDERRGRPSSHRAFGEGMAILSGDALFAAAFETLSGASGDGPGGPRFPEAPRAAGAHRDATRGRAAAGGAARGGGRPPGPSRVLAAVRALARSAGPAGLVGGQVSDLEAERGGGWGAERATGQESSVRLGAGPGAPSPALPILPAEVPRDDPEKLALELLRFLDTPAATALSRWSPPAAEEGRPPPSLSLPPAVRLFWVASIHARKTGALFSAACEAGATLGGGSPSLVRRSGAFGQALGLAFQVADDVLDASGSREQLGRDPGGDERRGKETFVAELGVPAATRLAVALLERAKGELAGGLGRDRLRGRGPGRPQTSPPERLRALLALADDALRLPRA